MDKTLCIIRQVLKTSEVWCELHIGNGAVEYLKTHHWISFRLDLSKAPARFWMLLGEVCSSCEYIASTPLLPETSELLHQVFLERGARATTAIEGNTLSEDEVSKLARGELNLPPSKEYLGTEVQNILDACNEMLNTLRDGQHLPLDVERLKALNGKVLNGLPLDDDVTPGEIRTHSVGVARYRGAPARDCQYLLARLCCWLNGMDFDLGTPFAPVIVKAVVAHLYLAWIHPFGDGNGRTARLVECQMLLDSGIPSSAAHLLSNHYNETRSEYYRQLDRSSKSHDGAMEFIVYALQGLADGLSAQIETIKEQAWQITWTNYVHNRFRDRRGFANIRRRNLVLDLSEADGPVPRRDIRTLTPRLAEAYLNKTTKTITRDVNALKEMGLVRQTKEGISPNKEIVLSFLPVTGSPSE